MTATDWRALRPHIPLQPGAPEYVARDGSSGKEIAQWIRAGRAPLLVGGPAGVGKSTELARAAELLQPDRVACLVQLDRFENMRRLTPDRMLLRIAHRLSILAQSVLHLQLSPGLNQALVRLDKALQHDRATLDSSAGALVDAAASEVARLSHQQRVTLLIDGLEKVPPGSDSLDLFEALAAIRDEVELVVVIPWHATFGPQAETVIRGGERFVAVRAIDVQGDAGESGRAVLRRILLQRLQLDAAALTGSQLALVEEAIRWSGGMPRVFLQLMADAGSYARLRGSEEWPSAEDLNDACADQVDSFRRLLLPGDVDAARAAAGTGGSELDLDRKVRLMAHGVLLERLDDGVRILILHPLAEAAFGTGGRHA